MTRQTFLTAALAALVAPLVAAKAALFKETPSSVPSPTGTRPTWKGNPVSLRMGVVGFERDTAVNPPPLVFQQTRPGGLASTTGWDDSYMMHYPIIGNSAEELLLKAHANVAMVIAAAEFPNDQERMVARLKELMDLLKVG